MDRRRFLLTSLAGALAAPRAAKAQQAGKVPRIGILVTANPRVYDAFVDQLRKLGYIEGQNLVLDFRNAEGHYERHTALAVDLVKAGVNVILAAGSEAPLRAARQASATIPVVMVAIDFDPLAHGYVTSLARPGGNVTGVFLQQTELSTKRMELLKAALPKLTRVAILWDASATDQFRASEIAARRLGLDVHSLELRGPSHDLPGAFAAAVKEHAGAIFVVTSSNTFRDRGPIAQLAIQNRLPAIFASQEWAEAGGLMSYGANLAEMMRRAAGFVDKILKGAKPGNLPIEQPTKFELVINIKTAKALGLTIPPSLLARADEVLQ